MRKKNPTVSSLSNLREYKISFPPTRNTNNITNQFNSFSLEIFQQFIKQLTVSEEASYLKPRSNRRKLV